MAAYCWVHDSHHLQADCQEPGSTPEPYARQSSTGYLYLFFCQHHAFELLVWKSHLQMTYYVLDI